MLELQFTNEIGAKLLNNKRYQVSSGEFVLVINQKNPSEAASDAIRFHSESNHHTFLGEITMVEEKISLEAPLKNRFQIESEDAVFFSTRALLDGIFNESPGRTFNS